MIIVFFIIRLDDFNLDFLFHDKELPNSWPRTFTYLKLNKWKVIIVTCNKIYIFIVGTRETKFDSHLRARVSKGLNNGFVPWIWEVLHKVINWSHMSHRSLHKDAEHGYHCKSSCNKDSNQWNLEVIETPN